MLWILIGFNADPDPGSKTSTYPKSQKSQKIEISHKNILEVLGQKHTYEGTKACLKGRIPGYLLIFWESSMLIRIHNTGFYEEQLFL
jgi:hypothetical protein